MGIAGVAGVIQIILNVIGKVGVTVEEGKRVWNELMALFPGLQDKSTEEIAQIMAEGWDNTEILNEVFKAQLAADRAAAGETPAAPPPEPSLPLPFDAPVAGEVVSEEPGVDPDATGGFSLGEPDTLPAPRRRKR